MTGKIPKLLALAAVAAIAVTPAGARELVYGSWLGNNNATNTKALEPYFEMVKEATGGEIEWKLVGGGQLANGPGTPEAVGSNVMDAGLVMAPYQPRMLPATNLIFSQSLTGNDYLASVGAMNEAVMLGCPECRDEYERANAVAFAGYGTSPYLLMCRGDVASIDDLKGKKVRASGGGVNITELFGGTPVSMPPSDATAALERGTIDCVMGAVAWLTSYGYMDVTDSVIQAPLGMGGPPMMMYVNRDQWKEMTPEQRKAHIEHAPDLITMETFDAQIAVDAATVEKAKAKGIKFTEGGAPFDDIMGQRDKIQYGLNVENAATAGVKDPKAILDAYLAAYEKWKGIIKDEVGDDRAKFREALWREVYSKVDPEAL
ncbi:MAG: C4-dicarboxylate TRAP transporter substrate-binding protein [Oricola sp.]